MAPHSGIDVSNYQGDIDWKRVKASSIEFAMLRASYGSGSVEKQTDARFHKNAYEAAMAGLFIGAYHNIFASTTDEAHKEAELFLKVVDGYRFAYPVAVNIEDYVLRYLPPDRLSKIVLAWCRDLRAADYYPVIFGTADTFKYRMKKEMLEENEIWLAELGETPTYDGKFGLRQYSVGGKIDGMRGFYNLDYAYQDYASMIYNKGLNGFTPPQEPKPEPVNPPKTEKSPKPVNPPEVVPPPQKAKQPKPEKQSAFSDKPPKTPYETVTVQEGDTLAGIASQYGMTVRELYKYGCNYDLIGWNPNKLRPGTNLCVPVKHQWPMPLLHPGIKVEYSGPRYRTSYGWLPRPDVSGTFTLSKIVYGRKAGAKLDKTGWVPISDLTIL